MIARTLFLSALAAGLGTLLAGCPSCPYDSRCVGSTLHTCWLGVDKIAGDPAKDARECRAPNPVCVDLDERTAQCVMEGSPTCDASFAPVCRDGWLVTCASGYQVAEDCAAHGNACLQAGEELRCVLDPATPCDGAVDKNRCEGNVLIRCDRFFLEAEDCTLADPPTTCQEFENEYGRSAYCG